MLFDWRNKALQEVLVAVVEGRRQRGRPKLKMGGQHDG